MSSLLAEIFKVREGIKRKAGETHVKVTWWLWGFRFVCRETVRVSVHAAVQRAMPLQRHLCSYKEEGGSLPGILSRHWFPVSS